ncbi:hypothetical protein [Paenibacillus xanthanilyticus]|uniref:Uncharacterized protein n=1 Tax=Paenibacillus xanthanilyticus TaxID=1783531 RepID=A0ABV8KB77_9BACL
MAEHSRAISGKHEEKKRITLDIQMILAQLGLKEKWEEELKSAGRAE